MLLNCVRERNKAVVTPQELRERAEDRDTDESLSLTTINIMAEAADEIEQLRAEREIVLQEHELMRKTLQTIAGNTADGLQRTQAIGALSNIGARS